MTIKEQLQSLRTSARKGVAVLIDPDKLPESEVDERVKAIEAQQVDFIFVGGSLITNAGYERTISAIKKAATTPLVLFPGSPTQLSRDVDAVLFLSLVSGRNPELLIGHHVTAAPRIRELQLETVATAYMLIEGGRQTTASYISNTNPIPRDKVGIAAATAMASEMLGMHAIYLDAGSGADLPVPTDMIEAVRASTNLPLIVGGGIRSREAISFAHQAGADLVIVGTAIEEQPELIASFFTS